MRRKPVDHATLNPSSAATSLLNPLIYDHLLVMLPSIPPSVLQLGLLSGMHHNRYQKGQRRLSVNTLDSLLATLSIFIFMMKKGLSMADVAGRPYQLSHAGFHLGDSPPRCHARCDRV
jgi:hypothetical protein